MDHDEIWRHVHAERAALADNLSRLSPEQWDHDSLCTGWTVKDVAAHVISTPQLGVGQVLAMVGRNLGRGYNAMIYRETKRISARESPESILADFATYADSRHHVFTTTSVEPLVDALVHHQDITRPLGINREAAPDAAAVAADRCRLLSPFMGSRRLVRSVRMVATDIDWARGSGPTIEAPMQELLMLCAGRSPDRTLLSGEGRELLAQA